MIAADSSTLIAYLGGEVGDDVEQIEAAMAGRQLVFPPPVVTELWAGAVPNNELKLLLSETGLLPISEGFWARAGQNRRLLIEKGLKARFAVALVAQCCIDADVPLIARHKDYRHFERWCGLKLAQ